MWVVGAAGNRAVATALAAIVHADVRIDPELESQIMRETGQVSVDVDNIGVWIDPIDGTNQYIKGGIEAPNAFGIFPRGLQVPCVLLGAFDLSTGEPLLGIVNQPFANGVRLAGRPNAVVWLGRSVWGAAVPRTLLTDARPDDGTLFRVHGSHAVTRPDPTEYGPGARIAEYVHAQPAAMPVHRRPVVVMGDQDAQRFAARATEAQIDLCTASGAGYKLLCVADRRADAFILTSDSTYKVCERASCAGLCAARWHTHGDSAAVGHVRTARHSASDGRHGRDVQRSADSLPSAQRLGCRRRQRAVGERWRHGGGCGGGAAAILSGPPTAALTLRRWESRNGHPVSAHVANWPWLRPGAVPSPHCWQATGAARPMRQCGATGVMVVQAGIGAGGAEEAPRDRMMMTPTTVVVAVASAVGDIGDERAIGMAWRWCWRSP